MRFAMLALGTTQAEFSPRLREEAHALMRLVHETAVLREWRRAIASAAAAEHAADLAELLEADETRRHARGKAGSIRKPRQGWSKVAMRALNARICCACRVIRPRALMWRVMNLKRSTPPGELIKPQRRRRVRGRMVWLRAVRAPGAAASVATPAELATAARLAALPEGSLVEKKAKLKAVRAAEAVTKRGRVAIQRLSDGASAEMQADAALWSPPVPGVRSVYVCRDAACVRAATKLKARAFALCSMLSSSALPLKRAPAQLFGKGLRGPVGADVPAALAAVTEVEAVAAEARPSDAHPPGVTPDLAQRIALLEPRVPPRPTKELRGPHDNWFAPPLGPRRG